MILHGFSNRLLLSLLRFEIYEFHRRSHCFASHQIGLVFDLSKVFLSR